MTVREYEQLNVRIPVKLSDKINSIVRRKKRNENPKFRKEKLVIGFLENAVNNYEKEGN